MTIIWDFSSQEPVFAIEAEEAEGILGVVLSPGVRLKKKRKSPSWLLPTSGYEVL